MGAIVGRRGARQRRNVSPETPPKGNGREEGGVDPPTSPAITKKARRRKTRPTTTQAVILTGPSGDARRVTEAMAKTRERIFLKDMDVASVGFKRTRTGGLVLQVAG